MSKSHLQDQGPILMQIIQTRLTSSYREAHAYVLRYGSKKLATYPPDSDEYIALKLMLATWNNIAVLQRNGYIGGDALFQIAPFRTVWDHLEEGIEHIRKTYSDASAYIDLEEAVSDYDNWYKTTGSQRYLSMDAVTSSWCGDPVDRY